MDEKYPKKIRLHKKKDFQSVFKSKFLESSYLKIFYKKNGHSFSRFGIIASGKIKSAVKRNYAKRRIREIVRKNKYAIPSPYDFVILAKVDIAGVEYKRLQDEFLNMIKNVK